VTEKAENVKKAPEKKVPKLSKKQAARMRLHVGAKKPVPAKEVPAAAPAPGTAPK